jgi:hypothetical protein
LGDSSGVFMKYIKSKEDAEKALLCVKPCDVVYNDDSDGKILILLVGNERGANSGDLAGNCLASEHIILLS